jgi:hypothetical protein
MERGDDHLCRKEAAPALSFVPAERKNENMPDECFTKLAILTLPLHLLRKMDTIQLSNTSKLDYSNTSKLDFSNTSKLDFSNT